MLSIKNLHAYYGQSHILQGIDLEVPAGAVVSLLGRNGAGRSTALKAIIGEVQAQGSVRLDDAEMIGLPQHRVARAGIAYVPESRDVFPELTVRKNLSLGMKRGPGGESKWKLEEMFQRFPRLAERAEVNAGSLSGGEQQMLTICRSLLGNPRVMLVDEPTEGLAPKVVAQVAELLSDIAAAGVGILLVEQKLTIAMRLSRTVHVMGRGQIVYSGSPEALTAQPEIFRQWLAV
ncbi:ABC transporter ATP-binding protein [Caenimonas soli]|uniref:ABC transporter ATP-binding protein n=1 Tax=Caenimonas soli TaxID=2735555 RepID=UPI00155705D3|nr:ABC transporter ATP-binding protein [Caenimonas soli]NPC55622.1 ABC transporter ATP-binding protein [Caenimonas soli]